MGQKRGNRDKNNKRSRDDSAGDNTDTRERSYTSAYPDRGEISHPLFTQYYKGNVVPEEEWDAMTDAMRQQLPIAFRVSNITGPQDQILNLLNGECFGLPTTPTQVTAEDGSTATLSRPEKIDFYRPKGNAFQMDLGRRELKRFSQIDKFRQFLILHNNVGNITRQEAVSMIPPLLLDVKPHHVVLDMCAAPGSKTSQLLEALHQGLAPGEIPSGIVIANDANPDRAYMLVHQLKRLGSPSFMVTTHEGQSFPTLFSPTTSSIASEAAGFREGNFQTYQDKTNAYFTNATVPQLDEQGNPLTTPLAPVLFDRILCDVPCGGDGTMRKTPTVWSNWQLHNSYALHPLQLMIAWRALQLLKVGGLMVYSTCSINPIEDEAVVTELIRRSNGTLELVNIPDILPELKHIPGRPAWKDFAEIPKQGQVPASLVEITSLQDILDLPDHVQRKLRPTEFSPPLLAKLRTEAQIYVKEQIARWEQHVATTKAQFPTIEEARADFVKRRDELKATEAEKDTETTSSTTTTDNNNNNNNNKHKKKGHPKGKQFKDNYVVNSFVRELLRMKSCEPAVNIDYTTRVLPHQQNTGGFYIALLRKVGQLPSLDESLVPLPPVYSMRYDLFNDVYSYDPEQHAVPPPGEDLVDASRIANKAKATAAKNSVDESQPASTETTTTTTVPQEDTTTQTTNDSSTTTTTPKTTTTPTTTTAPARWNKDPFVPSPAHLYQCLSSVWGVKAPLTLLARNQSKHYLMSKAVQELILCPQNYRLKVVHGGLKAFEQDTFLSNMYNNDDVSTSIKLAYPSESYFRVCQDGAQYMAQFINQQKVIVSKADMIALLSQTESTNINDLSEETKTFLLNKNNRSETDLTKVVRAGSCIIHYSEPGKNISLAVAALKRAYSISLLVDQVERDAYKYILGLMPNPDNIPDKGEPNEEVQL